MRIAYLAAGAAGMYCGSCLHDNTLAAQLLAMGEDVVLVPIYTPIRTDEKDVSENRVFYGGINVYLQQKWPLFRRLPKWLDRWLDHPAILGRLGGRASSVDPAQLGDLTVSMLQGEAGNQRKELEVLVDWLIDEVKPDVVHLSNSHDAGAGTDDCRALRSAGGLFALGRGHLSRATRRSALRASSPALAGTCRRRQCLGGAQHVLRRLHVRLSSR